MHVRVVDSSGTVGGLFGVIIAFVYKVVFCTII